MVEAQKIMWTKLKHKPFYEKEIHCIYIIPVSCCLERGNIFLIAFWFFWIFWFYVLNFSFACSNVCFLSLLPLDLTDVVFTCYKIDNLCVLFYHYLASFAIFWSFREGLNSKKMFSFRHCPNKGGGVYPCPNFLTLFQEVHFWSIKRVYFFKNANVLNF